MDITKSQRPLPGRKFISPRQRLLSAAIIVVLGVVLAVASWYPHRHDQMIDGGRYQVVYLVTGQIYFGKLQNTTGQYMTLQDAYTVESPAASSGTAGSVTAPSKILKVSQQVYGPDDSMAIRTDQVQFWQNLQPDSKVVKAIQSGPQQ